MTPLTALEGNPFTAGSAPIAAAVELSGRFVYTANLTSNDVSGFVIDPATGALTAIAGSPIAANDAPHSIVVTGTLE